MELKRVTPDDIFILQTIGCQTFTETFADTNTEEDMDKYLADSFNLEKLTEELNDRNSLFYFAIDGEQVIGYLKVNFGESQTELNDSQSLEIERIYTLKEYHGKGVGQLLYNEALRIAGEKGARYVWLGVWEKNERAIRFYRKNGFTEFDKHIFRLGSDEQTDIMMRLDL